MDPNQLPQPTPPQTDNQIPSPGTVSVAQTPNQVVPPTSDTPAPPASVSPTSVPPVSPPPSVTLPAATPTMNNNGSSQPEQAPQFSSPIIEGLRQIDSQPFQPQAASASVASPDQPSQSNVPHEATPSVSPQASAAKAAAPAKQPQSASSPPPKWRQLLGNKMLMGGVIGAIILIAGLALLWNWWSGREVKLENGSPSVQVKLVYWGLWEEKELLQPLITKYQQQNPGVTIEYQLQNKRQYRDRLQAAITQGRGPDIFRFHNTWVPMLSDQLAAAPRAVFPASELEGEFYPVMKQDLVKGNQAYGVPLMYDGLALVYNTAMLQAANAQPPSDWREVRDLAASLTVRNGNRLERGGIAVGTADNVDHFSDILALLMLQNGANPGNPSTENATTALAFYTIFSRQDQTWDTTMAQSTLAFANEQVAMIIVPSWRLHEIERLNPNLNYGVDVIPQLSDDRLTWATYWAEGVSKQSAHQEEAWKFIAWLSQPEQLRALYSEASKYRGFGELYPRVSMAEELSDDPHLAPYLQDALYARSWYMSDATHDEGLNDKLKAHYLDAVNATNQSGSAENALEQIAPGITQTLTQYGIPVRAAPSGL